MISVQIFLALVSVALFTAIAIIGYKDYKNKEE